MANNTKILKFNSGTEYDFRPFVICETSASTVVKSITLNDFTLFTGATIIVKFTNGNTANTMSLSINKSNPIEVDYPVTDIGTYEFVYDGNKWLNLTVNHPYLLSKLYNQDFSTAYNETDSIWCELGKLSDNNNSPVIYIIRSYPHASYIFTISKGWSNSGNITQLQASTGGNSDYPYITGTRLLSDGTIEIKIHKPTTTLTHKTQIHAIAISSDIKNTDGTNALHNELTLTKYGDTTDISILKSLDFSNNSIVADKFVGALTGDVTGNVTGNLTGNVTGNLTGNAKSATNAEKAVLATTAETALNANNAEKLQDIEYFEYKFTVDSGASYLLIADLSDWSITSNSNHYLIGSIYGNRGDVASNISNANFNGTGIYNITAIVSSYYDSTKPDADFSKYYTQKLYVNNTANLLETSNGKAKLVEPCIVEYEYNGNKKKYLALKKIGSSSYIRFTGLMNGILAQKYWIEINEASCTEYATANYTDGYAITTEKYYDGSKINTLVHSNNFSEYTKEIEKKIAGLAAGLTLSLSVTGQNPNDTSKYISVIHRGGNATLKISATVKNNSGNVNANITIKDGNSVIGTNIKENQQPDTAVCTVVKTINANNSSYTYTAIADVDGLELNKSASITAKYPVYYGMLNKDITFTNTTLSSLTKATPITTIVSNTFNAKANSDNMRFYLLVPSDVTGSKSFTMGGAPVNMLDKKQTINSISYTIYYTNAIYNKNAELQIKAN